MGSTFPIQVKLGAHIRQCTACSSTHHMHLRRASARSFCLAGDCAIAWHCINGVDFNVTTHPARSLTVPRLSTMYMLLANAAAAAFETPKLTTSASAHSRSAGDGASYPSTSRAPRAWCVVGARPLHLSRSLSAARRELPQARERCTCVGPHWCAKKTTRRAHASQSQTVLIVNIIP